LDNAGVPDFVVSECNHHSQKVSAIAKMLGRSLHCLNSILWHPLKGSCQQKTPRHRKSDLFFCRNKIQYGVRPVFTCTRNFFKFAVQTQ
jgi:hypothetical protein